MLRFFSILHERDPFCGVLNRKEKCVVPAGLLARELSLPLLIEDPVLARDKYRMRQAMNQAVGGPRCVLLTSVSDARHVPDNFFPAVLKPRFGFNSRGVCLVTNHKTLVSSFLVQFAAYATLKRQDGTGSDFVVEELISGTEHTIDSFVVNGEACLHLISDKQPMSHPWFVEVGDDIPTALCEDRQRTIRDCVQSTIRSLGIRNGWTHTEVRVSENAVVPIECAARMGGGYFEDLIRTAWSIDRMDWLIRLFRGERMPEYRPIPQPVSGRRLVVYGDSRRRTLANATALFKRRNVKLLWPDIPEKISRSLAGPPSEFNNTLFEFMTFGSTPSEVRRDADAILLNAQIIETSE